MVGSRVSTVGGIRYAVGTVSILAFAIVVVVGASHGNAGANSVHSHSGLCAPQLGQFSPANGSLLAVLAHAVLVDDAVANVHLVRSELFVSVGEHALGSVLAAAELVIATQARLVALGDAGIGLVTVKGIFEKRSERVDVRNSGVGNHHHHHHLRGS